MGGEHLVAQGDLWPLRCLHEFWSSEMGFTRNIGNRSSTYEIADSDSTINLAKGDTINVSNSSGILQSPDFHSDAIDVEGEIHVIGGSGLLIRGMDNTITAGFDSIITGNIGLWLDNDGSGSVADGNVVVNKGQIVATADGIRNESLGTSILNISTLDAENAVVGLTYGLTLINAEFAKIDGDTSIDLSGVTDGSQMSRITNNGAISGTIVGGDEREIITNHGTISGNVLLADGQDVFDNRGGTVDGLIEGGTGNDIYFVDNADANLIEDATGGTNDAVHSTVSFTLGANFESLFLLGSARTSGIGNAEGNSIFGNRGNNILKGRGGDDALSGGKGNDVLFGGAGADDFEFDKGTGHDTIRDFTANGKGHDIINLSNFLEIGDLSNLKKHYLEEHHGDVLITLGHGDVITLEDTATADLQAADFRFAND